MANFENWSVLSAASFCWSPSVQSRFRSAKEARRSVRFPSGRLLCLASSRSFSPTSVSVPRRFSERCCCCHDLRNDNPGARQQGYTNKLRCCMLRNLRRIADRLGATPEMETWLGYSPCNIYGSSAWTSRAPQASPLLVAHGCALVLSRQPRELAVWGSWDDSITRDFRRAISCFSSQYFDHLRTTEAYRVPEQYFPPRSFVPRRVDYSASGNGGPEFQDAKLTRTLSALTPTVPPLFELFETSLSTWQHREKLVAAAKHDSPTLVAGRLSSQQPPGSKPCLGG